MQNSSFAQWKHRLSTSCFEGVLSLSDEFESLFQELFGGAKTKWDTMNNFALCLIVFM